MNYIIKSMLRIKDFQEFVLTIFPELRFETLRVSSNSVFSSKLFISKDSRIFLSCKLLSLAKILRHI